MLGYSSSDIFIVAGEASGDLLGARLIKELLTINPNLKFGGVGGYAMEQYGFHSVIPIETLAVMGIKEVIPKLPQIWRAWRIVKKAIISQRPKIVITIDAPGFNNRVARFAKSKGIKVIHYVAPTVWAWRPKRAKKLAKIVDHLLCLLPFEPPYFTPYGLNATFVGHSAIENLLPENCIGFRDHYKIPQAATLITILPGSRVNEIEKHLPIFLDAFAILAKKHQVWGVIPTLPNLYHAVSENVKASGLPITVIAHPERYFAFMESAAAIAASGTVTLELALCGLPQIIAYRIAPLSYFIGKRMIKTQWVNLINILCCKNVIPELIQNACNANQIAWHLGKLLQSSAEQSTMRQGYAQALSMLTPINFSPSQIAAQIVYQHLYNV